MGLRQPVRSAHTITFESSDPVLITGANGYVGSHIVRAALEAGLSVRGTVRDSHDSQKTQHLQALPGAERLALVDACNEMQPHEWHDVASGCSAVIHTASPFLPSSKIARKGDVIDPAVDGTRHVMAGAHSAGITRMLVTSSVASIFFGRQGPGHVFTEQDWSDIPLMEEKRQWYPLSKTLAEHAAWNFAKAFPDVKLTTLCPSLVFGPQFHPGMNTSSETLAAYVRGDMQGKLPTRGSAVLVDVRDVAQAHVRALQYGAVGRFMLVGSVTPWAAVVKCLQDAPGVDASKLPDITDRDLSAEPTHPVSCKRAEEELDMSWTPLCASVTEHVASMQKLGLL